MKELNLEQMEKIKGGCGYMEAGGVLAMGGMGVALALMGPVGWAGALIAGVGGMALTVYCSS